MKQPTWAIATASFDPTLYGKDYEACAGHDVGDYIFLDDVLRDEWIFGTNLATMKEGKFHGSNLEGVYDVLKMIELENEMKEKKKQGSHPLFGFRFVEDLQIQSVASGWIGGTIHVVNSGNSLLQFGGWIQGVPGTTRRNQVLQMDFNEPEHGVVEYDRWEEVKVEEEDGTIPPPRDDHFSGYFDDLSVMIVFGGYNASGGFGSPTTGQTGRMNDVHFWSCEQNRWITDEVTVTENRVDDVEKLVWCSFAKNSKIKSNEVGSYGLFDDLNAGLPPGRRAPGGCVFQEDADSVPGGTEVKGMEKIWRMYIHGGNGKTDETHLCNDGKEREERER